ncbi:MAG TPA: DUF4149 domain-containing protein [Acetobacteraceae bacterium]|nr:DUF4149 domain-containing protein [Acetobacteraceae bacterium]
MSDMIGDVLAYLGLAALIGGMLFFGAIVAPLVFTKLPPETAGAFIRTMFPRYYGYMIVTSLIAAGGFWLRGGMISAVLLVLLALLTCWLMFYLIPHLNMLRDSGQTASFNRGHTLSVWLNGVELLTALGVLVRLALG